jgi:hypothetical protein
MLNDKRELRPPRKWVTRIYQKLAAGRYAAEWLVEFLIMYERMIQENGQEQADLWALEEIVLTLRPSIAYKAFKLLRMMYLGWKAYRRIAGD